MELLKSKIFWVNVIGFAIQILQWASGIYPIDPVLINVIQGILTVILRALQGKEIVVGARVYKL